MPERRAKGQAYVLVVLALMVILATGAIVVDIGHLLLVKNRAQNAVDAAALAGASLIPTDYNAAVAKAQTFIVNNGFPQNEATITTPFNGQADQIEVILTHQTGLMLARLFGQSVSTVRAMAVAQSSGTVTAPAALDYAVVSGGNLDIAGSNNTFSGKIHANNQGKLTGSSNTGNDTFSAYSTIKVTGSGNVFPSFAPNRPKVVFPTLDINSITYDAVYDGDHQINDSDNGKLIRVNGDATYPGSSKTFTNLVVIATGKIHISGSTLTFNNNYTAHPQTGSLTFYAKGEIHLSGSNINIQGLLWSKQRFKLSGSSMTINGAVWGGVDLSYTEFTGSSNHINRDPNIGNGWPGTGQPAGVALVR